MIDIEKVVKNLKIYTDIKDELQNILMNKYYREVVALHAIAKGMKGFVLVGVLLMKIYGVFVVKKMLKL